MDQRSSGKENSPNLYETQKARIYMIKYMDFLRIVRTYTKIGRYRPFFGTTCLLKLKFKFKKVYCKKIFTHTFDESTFLKLLTDRNYSIVELI